MFLDKLTFKTYAEVEKKENEFLEVLGSGSLHEQTYQELAIFFKNLTEEERMKYEHTYWRWFTFLMWDRLSSVSQDDLVYFIDKQMVLVQILGFNVRKSLMDYFVLNCLDEQSAKTLFNKLKEKILDSQVVIGEEKGLPIRLEEITKRIRKMIRPISTTLEQAEQMTSLKRLIFPQNQSPSYMVATTVDEVLANLRDMIGFFIVAEVNKIWEIVTTYTEQEFLTRGEVFQNLNVVNNKEAKRQIKFEEPLKATTPKVNSKEVKPIVKSEPIKPIVQEVKPVVKEIKPEPKPEQKPEIKQPEKKAVVKATEKADDPMFFLSKKTATPKKEEPKKNVVVDESIVAPKALARPSVVGSVKKAEPISNAPKHRLSYKEIRKQIEGRFSKDKFGHFLNVTDVVNELHKISANQEDPHIKDLYYFNEQVGGFEWNENLLKD